MADRKRVRRVSELIRQIVSETLMFKVKNPDAQNISVHGVEVAENLRHVKIFVVPGGDKAQIEKAMAALEKSKGFVRKQISDQTDLKFAPELNFVYDESLDRADHIEALLRNIKR